MFIVPVYVLCWDDILPSDNLQFFLFVLLSAILAHPDVFTHTSSNLPQERGGSPAFSSPLSSSHTTGPLSRSPFISHSLFLQHMLAVTLMSMTVICVITELGWTVWLVEWSGPDDRGVCLCVCAAHWNRRPVTLSTNSCEVDLSVQDATQPPCTLFRLPAFRILHRVSSWETSSYLTHRHSEQTDRNTWKAFLITGKLSIVSVAHNLLL